MLKVQAAPGNCGRLAGMPNVRNGASLFTTASAKNSQLLQLLPPDAEAEMRRQLFVTHPRDAGYGRHDRNSCLPPGHTRGAPNTRQVLSEVRPPMSAAISPGSSVPVKDKSLVSCCWRGTVNGPYTAHTSDGRRRK